MFLCFYCYKCICNKTFCSPLLFQGWTATYNQRALSVRVLCSAGDKRCRIADLKPSEIRNVKFITREEGSHEGQCYKFNERIVNEDDFFPVLSSQLKTFEHSSLASEYWNNIATWIEKFGFKYVRKGEVYCWTSEQILKDPDTAEKFSKLPLGKKVPDDSLHEYKF